jgi:glycosyltransferase involved in cell wall biosynthesis
MLEALRADPCRIIEALFDFRQLRRFWRAWRSRGAEAIIDELSTSMVAAPSVAAAEVRKMEPEQGAILVIDACIPQHDRDAGSRSTYLYMQILREMGYRIYFMPNDQLRREPYATEMEKTGVQLLVGRGYRCGQWKKWLERNVGKISHVILHRPNVAMRYLPAIRRMKEVKVTYFACDLRFLRESRQYQVTGDTYHRSEAQYWERIERQIVAQVDRAYFFSSEETRIVSSWAGGEQARTIPLFPLAIQSDSGLQFSQRSGLLFVGGFSHQPNRDAVMWFAREVFPLVRSVLPDIEWHIVGREPPSEILELSEIGICVEGAVSEQCLETRYRTARLVVAPLRFGAGVKGKVVEALCHGIPVLTTQVGAEGIPNDDEIMLVSHSPEEMARQIIETYTDSLRWESVRERILCGAEQHFSRQTAMLHLAEGFNSMQTGASLTQHPA